MTGFKDPPTEYQFKPGNPGGPGKPPGSKNFSTILEKLLSKETDMELDGEKLTRKEVICLELMNIALTPGKATDKLGAIKEIIDRIEGKSIQRNREVDKDDNDINKMTESQLIDHVRKLSESPEIAGIFASAGTASPAKEDQ